MILKLWIRIGSLKTAFQLAVPIQCGAPIAFHLVKDSHTTTPSGSSAKIAKYVTAGSDQRKLGRPTFRPPELLVLPRSARVVMLCCCT